MERAQKQSIGNVGRFDSGESKAKMLKNAPNDFGVNVLLNCIDLFKNTFAIR